MSDSGTVRILGIAGSLRHGSFNAATLRAAQELAPAGMTIERFDIAPIPHYNEDVRQQDFPASVEGLRARIKAADGLLIVTPEYNSSVPPLVKNTIDWVTRVQDAHETRGQVFGGRAFAIAAASESRLGGMRALAALRLILSACHATVIPNQLALSFAGQAYDDMDRLKHPPDIEALGALVRQLIDVSQRMM